MAKVKVTTNMIFERYEKKYLLNQKQYESLTNELAYYASPDQYGLHTIGSIYYDTNDFSIIRKSLDKPKFKEKLRLRSYGTVGQDDIVYIELKKKFNGITYKRRIGLPLKIAMDYLDNGIAPNLTENEINSQTFGEIDWFVTKHQPSSKIMVAYDRIAMIGREDNGLRITFDASIRWRDYRLSAAAGSDGLLLRPQGTRLMEIKTANSLPLWLCGILSELEIYPESFSKCGKVYTEHLMNQVKEVARIAG